MSITPFADSDILNMSSSTISLCSEGNQIIQSFVFKLNNWIQIGCSILAVIVNVAFIMRDYRKIYFHKNVKIIILAILVANIGHSFFCIVLQGSHLYLYLSSTKGCQVVVPQYFCITLRGPMSIFLTSFVPFNTAIIIERYMATRYAGSYETKNGLLGILMVFISLILSSLLCIYVYSSDLSGYATFCSFATSLSGYLIRRIFFTGMGIELLTIVAFLWVWKLNAELKKRKMFDVKMNYQIQENLTALKLLLPLLLFHLVIFSAFNLGYAMIGYFFVRTNGINSKTAYSFAYVIPYYCLLSPFLLMSVARKQKRDRTREFIRVAAAANQDNYHDYYRKLW